MDLTGAAGYDDSDEENRQQMSEGGEEKNKTTNKNLTLSVPGVEKIKKEGNNERAGSDEKSPKKKEFSKCLRAMNNNDR